LEEIEDRITYSKESEEKKFDIGNNQYVSVKVHPKVKLNQSLIPILKQYAGKCHLWFDDNMDFSLDVHDEYKDLCD